MLKICRPLYVLAALAFAAAPGWALTPEEAGIKRWFDLFAAGQRELMYDAACSGKAGQMMLIDILTGGRGAWTSAFAGLFDVSRLNFTLLSREGSTAYVRVTGELGEPRSLVRPRLDWVSFTDKNRKRGYSDIVVAVYERGAWRHCDHLTLERARAYVAATPEAAKGIQDMGEYDLALEVFPPARAQAIVGAWTGWVECRGEKSSFSLSVRRMSTGGMEGQLSIEASQGGTRSWSGDTYVRLVAGHTHTFIQPVRWLNRSQRIQLPFMAGALRGIVNTDGAEMTGDVVLGTAGGASCGAFSATRR